MTAPVPALSHTRAIAFFRLPVAYVAVEVLTDRSPGYLKTALLNLKRRGLLRRVRMIRRRIHLEFQRHFAPEHSLREHALDGFFERKCGLAGHQVSIALALEAAWNARMAVVELRVELAAGELHFARIDDDDEIAGINVRSKGGLVLAAKNFGDFASNTAEGLVGRVHNKPRAICLRAGRGGSERSIGCSIGRSRHN